METLFAEYFSTESFVASFDIQKEHIFILSGYTIYKLDKAEAKVAAQRELFQKEGKSRALIADEAWIYCKDFCDLHILEAETLQTVRKLRLGEDLSSDIGDMHDDESDVYLSIRNGAMIRLHKGTLDYETYPVTDSSIWDFCLRGNRIYAGNVGGDLLVIDKPRMEVVTKIESGKQNLKSILVTEELLLTASQDKKMIARDPKSYAIRKTLNNIHKKAFAILGILDNQVYTICYPMGEIKVWDAQSWELAATLTFPGALTGEARIEGRRLFLASRSIKGLVYRDLMENKP
jgi:hypothetical protein